MLVHVHNFCKTLRILSSKFHATALNSRIYIYIMWMVVIYHVALIVLRCDCAASVRVVKSAIMA